MVFAAWLRRIPVIAHESDQTPGLANRLSMPFVDLLCVTFEPSKTSKYDQKIHVTGTPLRRSLFLGDKKKGLKFCGFNAQKPCLLVMGGSMGSVILNQTLRESLNELTTSYQIIHLCGRGNLDSSLKHHPHYQQFEYIDQELPDLIAASDIIVSRSGANSVYEWLALKKLHLLVPLSKKASRGDQIDNARYFEAKGTCLVVDEDAFSPKTLIQGLSTLETQKKIMLKHINALNIEAGNGKILKLIEQYATLKQSG